MPRNDEDDYEENEKLVAPPDFDGPVDNRHCTDVLILLLLLCMWVSMTGMGIYAAQEGDYRRVVYPLDYDGNICGTDIGNIDMTNFPVLYYVNNWGGGVCANKCPTVSSTTGNVSDIYTLVTYSGVFQAQGATLAPDFIEVGDYSNSSDALACTAATCYPNNDPNSSWVSAGVDQGWGWAYYAGDSYEVLWRCYYTLEAKTQILDLVNADEASGLDVTNEANAFFNRLYADCYVARWYIMGFGVGVCTAISLTYIFFMRMPLLLGSIVWSSILLTIILFFLGGYYTYNLAQDWDDADPQTVDFTTINATRGAGIALYVIGGFLVLMTCCLRKQIAIAIGCVKTAGRAINHMFFILAIPLIQATGLFCFVLIWLFYSINLASLGKITTKDIPLDFDGVEIAVREFEWDTFIVRSGWFMLFCLFWTSNFVTAVGDMTIALCVAKYYFTRDKWKIGSWTVFFSLWQVIRFHAGTCAYGSLLIAIVQVIRAVIAKAQREAKRANSKIAQCLLCCCQCCFCCLEKCLRFMSKNAYIQTAIFSTAFCSSCRKAFFLIARNFARIAAISYVSGAVLIIGKLFISSITTLSAYYFIVENLNDELNSTGGPITIIFLISYWVSDFFMDVFDIAITAVLHCFIADEEMFTDQVYAEADLRKYIDDHGAEKD